MRLCGSSYVSLLPGSWQEYVAQKVSAGEEAEGEVGSMIGLVPGKKFVANTRVSRRRVHKENRGGGEAVVDIRSD